MTMVGQFAAARSAPRFSRCLTPTTQREHENTEKINLGVLPTLRVLCRVHEIDFNYNTRVSLTYRGLPAAHRARRAHCGARRCCRRAGARTAPLRRVR